MSDLRRLAKQGKFKGKKIVVFGAVYYLDELREMLNSLGMDIGFIVDNNPAKIGQLGLGIEIRSVSSLADMMNKDAVAVIIASGYYLAMSQSLKKIGLVLNRDFFIVGNDSGFNFVGDFVRNTSYMVSAYAFYKKIARQCGGAPMRLIHMPCLGDVYIASMYLPAAEGAANAYESGCVLIVTRNTCKRVGELFGYREIKVVTEKQAAKLQAVMSFLRGGVNIKNMLYHGTSLENISQTPFYGKERPLVNFADYIAIGAYNLTGRPKPVLPEFSNRAETLDALFTQNGLVKGKTVLISPYSSHFAASITDEVWQDIIARLKEKGYTVATNCGGENEAALPGTAPLFIEIRDAAAFLESAGYFIGIRSGFCDVVSGAKCTKVVIYEKGLSVCDVNFFGFRAMGIADDVIEIVSDGRDMKAFADRVLANF
ncbi:MAG: hypothetical protein LBK56_06875 [Gracilibacteraceae bacterium]|nr:hypothetical protein [Gracilibacteraceae bacterium]